MLYWHGPFLYFYTSSLPTLSPLCDPLSLPHQSASLGGRLLCGHLPSWRFTLCFLWFVSVGAPAMPYGQRERYAPPLTVEGTLRALSFQGEAPSCGRVPRSPLPPLSERHAKTPMPALASAGPSWRNFKGRVHASRHSYRSDGKSGRTNGQKTPAYRLTFSPGGQNER
jgi:hypothetical protein